mmetsp:Transcript_7637/g.10525  ORF Transcript_7637/g.10525 Transcript_7637/m.10525 type:complete len:117 (-) Transcript_7637:376-726(-)
MTNNARRYNTSNKWHNKHWPTKQIIIFHQLHLSKMKCWIVDLFQPNNENSNGADFIKSTNNSLRLIFADSSPLYALDETKPVIAVGEFHLKLLEYISKHYPTMAAITDMLELLTHT